MKKINALGNQNKDEIQIIQTARTDDVGLFHEMLHWFHTLRDPARKNKELQIKCGTNNKGKLSDDMMKSEKIELWIGRKKRGNPLSEVILKMEEFRTIMGYTVNFSITIDGKTISYSPEEPLYGDDLSENLYRLCVGQELRYGHVIKVTTVSAAVIDRAKKSYDKIIKNYKHIISTLIYFSLVELVVNFIFLL